MHGRFGFERYTVYSAFNSSGPLLNYRVSKSMLFVYIFIAIEYLTVIASSDHGHDEGHEKAKYTEKYNANLNESNKWQSYLNAVSSAQDSYSEVSDLCKSVLNM